MKLFTIYKMVEIIRYFISLSFYLFFTFKFYHTPKIYSTLSILGKLNKRQRFRFHPTIKAI